MDRITAIKKSLAAFVCGIIGFLPLIGLLPAVHALNSWVAIRRKYTDWNPAADYLKWGAVLGAVGVLNSVLAAFVIAMSIMDSFWR